MAFQINVGDQLLPAGPREAKVLRGLRFALRILLRHEISLRSEEPLAREVLIHGAVGGTLPRATLPFPNFRLRAVRSCPGICLGRL